MSIRNILLGLFFTGFISAAHAQDNCTVDIEATNNMTFSKDEITVPATCSTITVNLKNTGKLPAALMGHNLVISKKENLIGLTNDSFEAGFKNNYVKPNDSRAIVVSKVIGGGESTSVTFKSDLFNKEDEYIFFCASPGHWSIMQGKFKLGQ
ncbi:azurin [Pseudoalteromonas sp. T1lg21]|uniref:azurin n=1 Tax=Pseudoalteromonas sp. T1lg21 TaxID=2077095 RepID=UPI000CF5DCDB|nr:azurin [Pseudoalteromonas sp. T1lg21]